MYAIRSYYDSAVALSNYDVKTSGNVKLAGSNVELLSDKMSVQFTLTDVNKANQQEVIDVVVEDVKDVNSNKISKTTTEDVAFIDTTLPEAISAEVVGNDTIKVKFSEPLLSSTVQKGAFSVNDGKLYVKSVSALNNNTEVNVVIYSKLTDGTRITSYNVCYTKLLR